MKPSNELGTERLGAKLRGWTESHNGNRFCGNARRGAEASEIADERKSGWSRGWGTHANRGRKPRRDGKQRGKHKMLETEIDQLLCKTLKIGTLEVLVGWNKPTSLKNARTR